MMAIDIASLLIQAPQVDTSGAASLAQAPFVWGQGGARITPDEVARRRQLNEQALVGDYSPVEHWTQGIGRMLDGYLAGRERNKLSEAADYNAQQADSARNAVLSGDTNAITEALLNPNVDTQTKSVLQAMTPKRWAPSTDLEKMLVQSGVQPGSPEWVDAMRQGVQNKIDPWTNIVSGGESIMGRQSMVQQALSGDAPKQPSWLDAFSPEELRVMQGEASRRAGSNIPNGSPLQGGPQVGAVENGYRFLGGDPEVESNWEPVR